MSAPPGRQCESRSRKGLSPPTVDVQWAVISRVGGFQGTPTCFGNRLYQRLESSFGILTRQKHHVDVKARWLPRPRRNQNNEGRMFPINGRLRDILETQLAKTEAIQRATGKIIPWLFPPRWQPD